MLKQSLPPFSQMQATPAPPQPPNPMGLASSTGRLSDLSSEEIQEAMMKEPSDPVTMGLQRYFRGLPPAHELDYNKTQEITSDKTPPSVPSEPSMDFSDEEVNPYKYYIKRHFDMHPLG